MCIEINVDELKKKESYKERNSQLSEDKVSVWYFVKSIFFKVFFFKAFFLKHFFKSIF